MNWIGNDLRIHQTDLNKLQKNTDPSKFHCWIYMENQKYFITDLECKLQATLSTKVKFKQNRPQNNKQNCIQVSIKKYFYSAQLKFIFIFIDEIEIISKGLASFKDIDLVLGNLKNGGVLIENKFGRTQRTQISETNSTINNSKALTRTSAKESENISTGEVSHMIKQFTQTDSYAEYTIDMVEPQPVPVPKPLNLNEAFFGNSQDSQETNKQNKKTTPDSNPIPDSFTFDPSNIENHKKISSQLNEFPLSFQTLNNVSRIDELPKNTSSSNNTNTTESPQSVIISELPAPVIRSSISITPINNAHNKLTSSLRNTPTIPQIIISTNPEVTAIEPNSESLFSPDQNKVTEDCSENMTNDEMNSSISSGGSSPNEFANHISPALSLSSPSSARKKKLLQKNNRAEFFDNKEQMTDDEDDDDNRDDQSVESAKYLSPFMPRRIKNRTYSTSSDSSSVRSGSASGNIGGSAKSHLFASKQYYHLKEKKILSEKKQPVNSILFSPISKYRKPNGVRGLLNQLNQSLATPENKLNTKEKPFQIAINKSEQLMRRKRLFNPNSQKVEDAFDNDELLSPNKEVTKDFLTERVSNKHSANSLQTSSNSMNSGRSIPGGQLANKSNMDVYQNSLNPSLLLDKSSLIIKKSLNTTQEAMSKHFFKINANNLQIYLRSLTKSIQQE